MQESLSQFPQGPSILAFDAIKQTPNSSMASPASSQTNSSVTSPEIKVTPDHGEGGDLQLSQPATGSRAVSCEENGPPSGSPSSTKAPPSNPTATSKQNKPDLKLDVKPELKRQTSGYGSLKIFKGLGNNGNRSSSSLFHRNEKSSAPHSLGSGSGTQSPTPETPNVKAIFSKNTCPDLNSVNRALEELRIQSRSEDDPFVKHLSRLQSEIRSAEQDCKKLLSLAMQERDLRRYEVCRGLCIRIVHNQHSQADTKVYAYNILATQASPGQAGKFLDEAAKLVQRDIPSPDKEKLMSVIALLRAGAVAKDTKSKTNGNVPSQENDSSTASKAPPTASGGLRVPAASMPSGAMTPKSEKILQWAAPPKRADSV
ncbi:uncharacterized protein MYCFIDRAFT_81205 [Pseudocercospora fijiensis CIRAD86]|uniref:Uncharacterized protein n=1 Tax=Pseudocercospora fijiensis (strain CIRAD86) TaxID=383855 RepID=M2YPS9_PSEFD|nr:uncharacterized protein MYCFIDRAFT_81205 [Pseudocercospora fijiensis CIRAD86]EME79730.1 hypothetical protein MYCFIDRAFT_81205 [Pseudocercospora fijiensis CIRAD86]